MADVELSTLGSVIKTAYEAEANTNAYTDAEKSKLAGVEASADVTDTANVTAAGALMDSEVTNLAQVKAFDSSDYATAAQGSTADTAVQPGDDAAGLGSGAATDGYVLTADGAGGAAWEAAAGGGAFTADGNGLISATSAPVLDAATGNEAAYTFNYTTNKATSGNDTGLLINQTDTASPGTSLLLDLQVGGSSVFKVESNGDITGPDVSSWNIRHGKDTDAQIAWFVGGAVSAIAFEDTAGNNYFRSDYLGNLALKNSGALGWSSGAASSTQDLSLYRDAANTLAQRNSTNAQTFRVYTSFTDSSNYERLAITGSAITVETAGTGTDDIDLTLTPAGAGNVRFGTHSAIGAETVTGYITIKDAGGTSRKLAVVS